jgi:hypothetical protein
MSPTRYRNEAGTAKIGGETRFLQLDPIDMKSRSTKFGQKLSNGVEDGRYGGNIM